MCVINDPLGQTYGSVTNDLYFEFKLCFVLLDFEKWEQSDVQ